MPTVLWRYLIALVVAGVWTVAAEGMSSLINFGPITNSWYSLLAPLFVIMMPAFANAFTVPFVRTLIEFGRVRAPTMRKFFLFLRISIVAYILFFVSNFCLRSTNDHPFLSLAWIAWVVILVLFSVLAFGVSGLALLCGFTDNSAIRCLTKAVTMYRKNIRGVTAVSSCILLFLIGIFELIKSLDHGRWFDFANNFYLFAFGACWVIANDLMKRLWNRAVAL
ncbi:hypothetical protein [Alicyclobacillus sendaiensis]|uniref:hypothetical protein n=1 Tax=Alicyclobacillus sendaiensis TaxID=192387 RepID=UPI0007864A8B|nr:hypothetical protein [Alicyclobacillus sendaiensis]